MRCLTCSRRAHPPPERLLAATALLKRYDYPKRVCWCTPRCPRCVCGLPLPSDVAVPPPSPVCVIQPKESDKAHRHTHTHTYRTHFLLRPPPGCGSAAAFLGASRGRLDVRNPSRVVGEVAASTCRKHERSETQLEERASRFRLLSSQLCARTPPFTVHVRWRVGGR